MRILHAKALLACFILSSTLPARAEHAVTGVDAEQGHTLTIVVSDIPVTAGNLHLALFQDAAAYADKQAHDAMIVPVDSVHRQIEFQNVTTGEVLVLLFHDVDRNGRLNTNWLGIPSEPYASSAGQRGRFGPPAWDKGKVSVDGDTRVEISLR